MSMDYTNLFFSITLNTINIYKKYLRVKRVEQKLITSLNNKMISKTKISKRTENKRNPEIIEIINIAKKNNLLDLAKKLSAPRSKYKNINLDELEKIEGSTILVIGKVLGSGYINKKIKISAMGFSNQAKKKLLKNNSDIQSIKMLLEKNSKLEGVTII